MNNPRRMPAPESALQLARAELNRARAGLCVHGIPAAICKDPHRE